MSTIVVLLSIPGLRSADIARMPHLKALVAEGDQTQLVPSFPGVTWPVETNMLTGVLPAQHGIVANGIYWRDQQRPQMWTLGNDKIQRPQIWDVLHQHDSSLRSAAWFPMLSKGCGADYVCMPAPVHNPDGSESLWCYTKPSDEYGRLRDELGHFPLQHFWGPLANIQSSAWIAQSAAIAAAAYQPEFFYIYLPHLDYAGQKLGPDSDAALAACAELDGVIGRLQQDFSVAYGNRVPTWLIASEYTIVPVKSVVYPNRLLRNSGMIQLQVDDMGREEIRYGESRAWAMVDHQIAHVYVNDEKDIGATADLFRRVPGISEVLVGNERSRYGLDHERSGDVVLASEADSWFAYYWWLDDQKAPAYARTVDIHRKPGYDPVELHVDRATRSIPLEASLIGGSHGAPARTDAQRGVLLSSQKGTFKERSMPDTDVFEIVLRQFGI